MKTVQKLLSVGFLLLACNIAFAQMPEANNRLPENMKFLSLDSIVVSNKDLPSDKPVLIIYFDPDCGHCQAMGKQLARRISSYPDLTIWMVSNYPDSSIKQFLFNDGIFPAKKLMVLQDYSQSMHNLFDFDAVPLMLLYSPKGNLLKDFDALPTPNQLTAILKKAQ